MADQTGAQQFFDLWKKQVEEGLEPRQMAGQGQSPDPQAFWRPFMDQGMQAWSKVMTQGSPRPTSWPSGSSFSTSGSPPVPRCSSRPWAPNFAQAMGKQLEGFLNRRTREEGRRAAYRGDAGRAGGAFASQVVGIAKHIISLGGRSTPSTIASTRCSSGWRS